MRITEKIEAGGYFWLPAHPERRIPGTLVIEDGGEVTLEVIGLFEELHEALNSPVEIPRINGEVEAHGFVTLEECVYLNKTISFGSLPRNRLRAHFALFKIAYDENEAIKFKTYELGVEGFEKWHALTGLKTNIQFQTRSAEISFSEPKPVEFWSSAGVRIHIRFAWSASNPGALTEAKITQRSFLRIEFENPASIEEFSKLAHKLIQFFTLGIGVVVCLRDVAARTVQKFDEQSEEDIRVPIYFKSVTFSEKPSDISVHNMLFRFSDFSGKHQEAITRWMEIYEKIGAAMNLYFSATGDPHKYLNIKFLWLAQALETYHRRTSSESQMSETEFKLLRWTVVEATPEPYRKFIKGKLAFANEPNLATRLKKMLGRFERHFGTLDEKDKLTRSIVNTRNYYTHYDPSLAKKAAQGNDLWKLCTSMEILFQLLMMSDMGFPDAKIDELVNRNDSLNRRLKS